VDYAVTSDQIRFDYGTFRTERSNGGIFRVRLDLQRHDLTESVSQESIRPFQRSQLCFRQVRLGNRVVRDQARLVLVFAP